MSLFSNQKFLILTNYEAQIFGYCKLFWSNFNLLIIEGYVMQLILNFSAPVLYSVLIFIILARVICSFSVGHFLLLPFNG